MHGGMRDFVAATVVSIRQLEGIQLSAKLECKAVEKRLCLSIRVKRGTLLASSCLPAINVVAIFVVEVYTIEFLVVNDGDKTGGDLFLLAKTVIPTVVLIACETRVATIDEDDN